MAKPFNPAKFADMLDRDFYSTGPKAEELKSERENLAAWLRKKGKKSRACLRLADKLEECEPRRRCRSAACPECATAGQRLIAEVTQKLLNAQAGEAKIVCVTIIPADGMIRPGKLDNADHDRAIPRWKERLGKAGVTWFIGATDISFNEHKQAQQKPKWSKHFYGIAVTNGPKKLKRKLRQQFPKNDVILRPVKLEEWDGDNRAMRYILKPNFWRRIATDDAQRYDEKTRSARRCRDTDTQPLRSKQKRELLLHLDDIGMQSRLLMRCCQLSNKKSKGPSILLRVPK
jgi:hypothetical protein